MNIDEGDYFRNEYLDCDYLVVKVHHHDGTVTLEKITGDPLYLRKDPEELRDREEIKKIGSNPDDPRLNNKSSE